MTCEITYQAAQTKYLQGVATKERWEKKATTESTDFGNCETKFWLLPEVIKQVEDGASVSIIKMQRKKWNG